MPILNSFPVCNAGSGSVFEATIGTTWIENSANGTKYQDVMISGITADSNVRVSHVYNGDDSSASYNTFTEQRSQYLTYVMNGVAKTIAGGIRYTIFGDANTVEIPIVVEVV